MQGAGWQAGKATLLLNVPDLYYSEFDVTDPSQ